MPEPELDPQNPPSPDPTLEEPTKPKHGFVTHIATGTQHELDDVQATLDAYPGQYEVTKEKDVNKNKLGWPKQD